MPPSLPRRIAEVQRAAGRLVWLAGMAWLAAAVVAATVALGLADYLLRPHDAALRWLLSATALGVAAWAAVKLALPVLSYHQGPIAVARRIERRFPQFGERLSSAVAFAAQAAEDPTAGSYGLRRAVIAEAEALAADLDFRAALDSRAARRALLAAAAAFALAGLLAGLNPLAASLALARLAMPWRDQPWPRRHELAFAGAPQRLALGDDLEIIVVDRRGEPPDAVQLLLRFDTPAGRRIETKEMKPLGERFVFRLDNVTRPFAYRARGGDDDTLPWAELLVVEPPKIVELAVRVEPPAYTRLPPRTEGRVVKALVDSRLSVRGRLDKPIHSARAKTQTADLALPDVAVTDGGLGFVAGSQAAWRVQRSGALWFELTDEHGLAFGRDTRIELVAIPDQPPTIAWETPGDHSLVTARAVLPVKGLVKDDLAVRAIQLRYLRPGASDQEQVIDLYAAQAASLPNTSSPLASGDSQPFNFPWDLARLPGLAPGDVLAVRITAEDDQPQLVTTTVRRLTIITEDELASRVAARQGSILGQLAEALRAQRQCREQTAAIESRLARSGRLEAGDLNHLQSVQHNQRQVQQLLGGGPEGVEGQIVALLAELAANRAEHQGAAQRLTELLAGVRELIAMPLPAIDQELTEAYKAAREAADALRLPPGAADCGDDPAAVVIEHLQAAGAGQDEVLRSLEHTVGTLSEWDSFSRLAREVGQMRADQERLAAETDELRLRSATAAESAPGQRTAARQLAQRQQELARRFDKLQTRMEEMLARLASTDELAAGALADALDAARRLAIGGQMRQAATRLTSGQLSPARQTQAAVLEGLRQLLDVLSSRRDYELARTVAALRQAAGELGALRQRGTQLADEVEAAAADNSADRQRRELLRLSRALEELDRQSEQLRRRLARLRAPRAAAALGRAAATAAAAAQSAAAASAADARQQARDAQRDLEEAEQEVAGAIVLAEEELAREQLARLEQLVAGIIARQSNLLAETQRLERLRRSGGLETAQQATLRSVAAEQNLLAEETEQLRPQAASADAFSLALEGAAGAMRRAGGLLLGGQTGAAPQTAQQQAIARLQHILAALRPDEPPGAPDSSPPDQQQPAASPPPGNLAGAMAELKLLTLLQESINRRTAELEQSRSAGTLTGDDEQELTTLSREQGKLADLVLGLIKATAERPEDERP